MNSTLEYYNEKAQKYFDDSVGLHVTGTQDRFLDAVKEGGRILDLGCGSGRDTKYFISRGYECIPADGSEAMCRLAEEYLGMPVRHMEFGELDEKDGYDGIYASASLMHLHIDELEQVMPAVIAALKPNGVLYISFKYGSDDMYLGKRYYTVMTEERFAGFMAKFPQAETTDIWISGDAHPGREDERWLHALIRRAE